MHWRTRLGQPAILIATLCGRSRYSSTVGAHDGESADDVMRRPNKHAPSRLVLRVGGSPALGRWTCQIRLFCRH